MIWLNLWKLIAIFFLFSTFSFAVTFDNYYNQKIDTDYDYYFKTDLSFPGSIQISTSQTNNVLSGNPSDLASGSIVCPGTSLSIQPDVQVRWGSNSFDVHSLYPHPFGTFTKPLACTSSGRQTRSGTWLSDSVYTSQKNIGISSSATTDSSNYNILQPFYNECVTYFDDATDIQYSNAKGGANIYCKGSYSIPGVSSGSLENPTTKPYTIQSTKSFSITGSGLDCFAAVHKEPNTPDFRIYYYAFGFSGSIQSGSKTIKIEDRQNSIDFQSTIPAMPVILQPGEEILLSVVIDNDGGVPTSITGVTSTNSQITVTPFDTSICGGLIPSSYPTVCSQGNGFNNPFNPGASRTTFMWLKSSATTNASTTLRFTHTTTSQVCNAQTTQTDLNLNQFQVDEVVRCEVTPAQLNAKQQQLYNFNLQCFNAVNAVIPCIGNNWAFNGLVGWIPVATNTGATAGTHSAVGSTGQLVYTTGTVSCASNLTVNASSEHLEVQPPSANLKQNQTQGFSATCTVGGNPSACTGNQWDPYNTLIGSLSGSSINSTNNTTSG